MASIEVLTAPNVNKPIGQTSVFLAGTIDMGKSEDWQASTIAYFREQRIPGTVTLFNPRRPDWDSSWEQKTSHPEFVRQVTWELDRIEQASWTLMYFAPGSMSPITLLELGLCIGDPNKRKRLVVVCPEGFWRKGNVDIVCQRYGIVQFPDVESAVNFINLNKRVF